MKITDFNYELPEELIAQQPLTERSQSRLMVVNRVAMTLSDNHFYDLPTLVEEGDLLVFNNTKVIPARLFGYKESGGKVEIFVERIHDLYRARALLRASKALKEGMKISIADDCAVTILAKEQGFYEIIFNQKILTVLAEHGHIPLPHYIKRSDSIEDKERYQSLLARKDGAVAAPTASLHFDQILLDKLASQQVQQAFVTLHVGLGTFQPVRVEDIEKHQMHSEYIDVPDETVQAILATKARGKRVIAVGTTVVRALETAARSSVLQAYQGDTTIFIYPGVSFHVVDAMITNFHLPQSTLLMLVSAFAGREFILQAYARAVAQRYRFFSYGDAMLIS
jgi:S-adenosylmethionine:tRNA ribosyltransferase-isomerase